MKSKKFLPGILVMVLIFGMTAVGCNSEINKIKSKPLKATSATFADFTVRANVPVEWTIDLTGSTSVGCNWGIRAIPELNFPGFAVNVPANSSSRTDPAYANEILSPGKKYVIKFTPEKAGLYQLKCVEMGMNVCRIIVIGK